MNIQTDLSSKFSQLQLHQLPPPSASSRVLVPKKPENSSTPSVNEKQWSCRNFFSKISCFKTRANSEADHLLSKDAKSKNRVCYSLQANKTSHISAAPLPVLEIIGTFLNPRDIAKFVRTSTQFVGLKTASMQFIKIFDSARNSIQASSLLTDMIRRANGRSLTISEKILPIMSKITKLDLFVPGYWFSKEKKKAIQLAPNTLSIISEQCSNLQILIVKKKGYYTEDEKAVLSDLEKKSVKLHTFCEPLTPPTPPRDTSFDVPSFT